MPEDRLHRALPEPRAHQPGLTIPTGLFAVLVVAILALLGMSARYYAHGDLNTIYCLLSLFFSTNLLICYWEVCLFLRPDHIEIRAGYWREKCSMTGRTPTREFLLTRVPLTRILSPTLWADVWAAYSQYDGSYADRRTFGYWTNPLRGYRQWHGDAGSYTHPVRGLYVRSPACRPCGNSRGHAVLAMGVRDLGLLGQLLRGQSAYPNQPTRGLHLYLRDQFPLGAVRPAGVVRLRSPDCGRQL